MEVKSLLKTEYDFVNWVTFPSSAKLINDETGKHVFWPQRTPEALPVKPGNLKVEVKAKREGLASWPYISYITVNAWDGSKWVEIKKWPFLELPASTFDWQSFSSEAVVPSGIVAIFVQLGGGKGITWFDDLKIYQDDVLIFSEDFSNWNPIIGAGVGAPIGGVAGYLLKEPLGPMVSEVVGAVVGGAVGGGVGLLTGLGIIPVPQIPSLGAAPEEPGAPARLGKYQITG